MNSSGDQDAATSLERMRGGDEESRGVRDLAAAVEQLRTQALPRAVEIADRVLRNALSSPRRSLPVRARPPHDHLRVSSQVIVTVLRERIDTHLVGAAVGRIGINVNRAEVLDELTVELFVQYGTDIMVVADQTRTLAREALDGILGRTDGLKVRVDVLPTHVHVSDVTVGDPHLVDPADEQVP